jgi:hypothetical protein
MDAAVKHQREPAPLFHTRRDVLIGTGTDWDEAVDNIALKIAR